MEELVDFYELHSRAKHEYYAAEDPLRKRAFEELGIFINTLQKFAYATTDITVPSYEAVEKLIDLIKRK